MNVDYYSFWRLPEIYCLIPPSSFIRHKNISRVLAECSVHTKIFFGKSSSTYDKQAFGLSPDYSFLCRWDFHILEWVDHPEYLTRTIGSNILLQEVQIWWYFATMVLLQVKSFPRNFQIVVKFLVSIQVFFCKLNLVLVTVLGCYNLQYLLCLFSSLCCLLILVKHFW